MHTFTAIALGKLISYLSRKLGIGGGSAAPGLIALKIDPDLVSRLSSKIPKNVIITGTNGKTTTARILAHFAKEEGLKVIRNHTGSNLERGIASTLIHDSKFMIQNSYDLGIWELDEAAFNSVAPKIKPDIVVFLNVFRDQLDRYGEINSIVKRWCETLKTMPSKTTVLVNGDDINTSRLGNCFKGKVLSFGVENYKIFGESVEKKISLKKLNFEAKNVRTHGLLGSSFSLLIHDSKFMIQLPLPGIYHIYDALAAFACASLLNLPNSHFTNSLINFQPAFGRFEEFGLTPPGWKHKLKGYIFLIKNPSGATQVFETIAPNIKPQDRLLLALNDNLADGTDVSWIWDGEFERLISRLSLRAQRSNLLNRLPRRSAPRNDIIVSGTRADDLALRLKYAGIDPKNIRVEPELKKALKQAQTGLKGTLFILPTYTAMLELQRILAKAGIKKHYWEEGN